VAGKPARNWQQFPSTHWSLIRRAAAESGVRPRKALGELLLLYLPALRAHLVFKRSVPPGEIDDFLHGFIVDKFLQHRLLAHAQEQKGKFRTLLLTALDRYVTSQHRYRSARKRAPDRLMSLTGTRAHDVPDDAATASRQFDLAWARQVLTEAVRRMREQCRASCRPDIWTVFEARVLAGVRCNARVASYDQLARRLHLATTQQAANLNVSGKRMFAHVLWSIVGEYTPENEIEEEIRDLRRLLAQGGGRRPARPGFQDDADSA
jgi:hypothetical protein